MQNKGQFIIIFKFTLFYAYSKVISLIGEHEKNAFRVVWVARKGS